MARPPALPRAAAPALIAVAALCALPAAAAAATLELQVENVAGNDGAVMVALFDKEADWRDHPARQEMKPAAAGAVVFRFDDLPPGDYAVALYHDRNGNGKLDTNLVGIPREPYGFSGKRGGIGPSSWGQARFAVPADGAKVVVRLGD